MRQIYIKAILSKIRKHLMTYTNSFESHAKISHNSKAVAEKRKKFCQKGFFRLGMLCSASAKVQKFFSSLRNQLATQTFYHLVQDI